MEKLFEGEYRLMQVLWDCGSVHSTQLVGLCREQLGWNKSTTYTVLRKLKQKGAVRHEDTLVTPLLTREEYRDWSTQELIERVYQGSALDLVAGLVRREQLTASDLEELRAIVAGEEGHG